MRGDEIKLRSTIHLVMSNKSMNRCPSPHTLGMDRTGSEGDGDYVSYILGFNIFLKIYYFSLPRDLQAFPGHPGILVQTGNAI